MADQQPNQQQLVLQFITESLQNLGTHIERLYDRTEILANRVIHIEGAVFPPPPPQPAAFAQQGG